MSNASSQQGLSNEPCCDLGGFLLSRYVAYFEFLPSPARFASALHNTQRLRPQTTFLRSPQCSALIGSPSVSLGGLVVSEHPMSSYSPTLTSRLVPSPPVLRSARYLRHMKALNDVLLTPELNYSRVRKQ